VCIVPKSHATVSLSAQGPFSEASLTHVFALDYERGSILISNKRTPPPKGVNRFRLCISYVLSASWTLEISDEYLVSCLVGHANCRGWPGVGGGAWGMLGVCGPIFVSDQYRQDAVRKCCPDRHFKRTSWNKTLEVVVVHVKWQRNVPLGSGTEAHLSPVFQYRRLNLEKRF
jgi:hypothetical protein